MGNSGKVLMLFKGDYNASTTYQKLNVVYYNNRSYVCKQTSTGNAPTNTTYWQALTGDSSAEIQALTNEVNTMNNVLGAKNLLPNTAVSTTSGGLTITKNDDGSIHISGTRSSGGDYYCQINNAPVLKDTNDYILSGITGGSSTTYQMVVQDFVNNTNLGILYDGDRDFSSTANGVKVFIVIRSGQTIDKTFYPMIRPASITDPTYQPYAKTNVELTADDAIVDISDSFYSSLQSGITLYDVNMHKQGKHIFGNFVAKTDSVFGTASTQILTLRHHPTKNINSYLATSKAQWGAQTLSLGYFYAESTGGLSVVSYAQDDNYVKICLDYVTS